MFEAVPIQTLREHRDAQTCQRHSGIRCDDAKVHAILGFGASIRQRLSLHGMNKYIHFQVRSRRIPGLCCAYRVYGIGFRGLGVGFRGYRVNGIGFRGLGVGFRV